MARFYTIILSFLILLLIFPTTHSFAVPAKPMPFTIFQPDGTQVTVRLRGDEHHHFYTTLDGYLIQQDKTGYFCYLRLNQENNMIFSDVRVNNVEKRTAREKAFLSTVDQHQVFSVVNNQVAQKRSRLKSRTASVVLKKFPTSGNVKSLVILVQYQDVRFTTPNVNLAFSDLLNKEDYSGNGGTGSVRDYFVDNSSGNFRPQYDVLGPVTLANNMSYYGGNDASDNDKAPHEMVIEACRQLDSTVDFSQYDTDGDGWVDNIYVFYAGKGEADGGSSDTVWPHAYNISATGTTLRLDGKNIGSYSCSNELEGATSSLVGIGTFTHEFCHVLGLPDLYPTNYTSAFTPGRWSVLDQGSYNNGGKTPPYMSAFERYSLGWLTPTELTAAKSITLRNISQNEGYIIRTNKNDEYFLLENRQRTGSDTYIPGHGMLVWHIDYNANVWNQNLVNDTPSHQYVDIEEADGIQSENSRAGDAFPGTSNKTVFADTTTPNMKTWGGVSLNKSITNIAEANDMISFDFKGGDAFLATPVATSATNTKSTSFTATWEAYAGAEYYELDVYQLDVNSQKQYVVGFQAKNVGNILSFDVTGLQPKTKYYFVIRGATRYAVSSNSNELFTTTAAPMFDYFSPVAVVARDTTSTSFTANWKQMTDATGYFLDVYKKTEPTLMSTNITFSNRLTDLPSGWGSTAVNFYTSSGFCGQGSPSLKLDNNNQYIKSQIYSSEISSLKFWYRGENASSGTLAVQGYNGTEWKDLRVINPLSNLAGGKSIELSASELKGMYAVRWVYTKVTGNVALDDIVITSDEPSSLVAIPEYTNKGVQNVLSFNVTGLQPATEYYYTVYATNGSLISKKSNEIKVTTKSSGSGLQNVDSDYQIEILPLEVIINSSSKFGEDISIYNLAGQIITSSKLNNTFRLSRSGLAKGIYFIKVGNSIRKLIL